MNILSLPTKQESTNKLALWILCLSLVSLAISPSASAKDLYLATDGNDSVSYSDNSISSPWGSLNHALYNLKAGDTLYIRGGTYTPQYPLWLYSTYHSQTYGGHPSKSMNAESGTTENPVIIENYENETPIFDLKNISDTFIHLDNKSYWTFRGLTFINTSQVFKVAQDAESTHNTFDKLTVRMTRGGDNYAAIHVKAVRGDHTTITNSDIEGPGQNVHQNTGALYVNRVNHLKVLNNKLRHAPIGIYFKHVNQVSSASETDIEVAYNYIDNTGRASLEWNGRFGKIHNNVFGPNTAKATFNNPNGGAGGDYNKITFNTFTDGALWLGGKSEGAGDIFPGALGNIITDNIFSGRLDIHLYSSLPHETEFARNIHPTSSSVVYNSESNSLPLHLSSLVGTPTYMGNSDPTVISGYALAPGSLGLGEGTNGADLGADTTLVIASLTSSLPSEADQEQPPEQSVEPEIAGNECDNWQTNEPDWIWCDSFESSSGLNQRYEDVSVDGLSVDSTQANQGSKSLKQSYNAGQVNAGWLIKVEPEGFPDHIFYRWYHKFEPGMSSFPPKMARAGYRNRNTWQTVFMVHNWIDNSNPTIDVVANNSSQGPWLPVSVSDYDFVQNDGEWAAFEVEIKLNSPGQTNGHYRMWINDQLAIERTDIDLRGNTSDKINEVMLDNYWNGGAPGNVARYFDNFVISTKRIGLTGNPIQSSALPPSDLSFN